MLNYQQCWLTLALSLKPFHWQFLFMIAIKCNLVLISKYEIYRDLWIHSLQAVGLALHRIETGGNRYPGSVQRIQIWIWGSFIFFLHCIYITPLHKPQIIKPQAEAWSCQHKALSLAELTADVWLHTVKAYSIIIHRFVLLHESLIKLVLKNLLLSRLLRAWHNVPVGSN